MKSLIYDVACLVGFLIGIAGFTTIKILFGDN